jgi:diguanylate cyclase (GGDEF)-like protein
MNRSPQDPHKTGLRRRLLSAMLVAGALPLLLGLVLLFFKGREVIQSTIGINFEGIAREAALTSEMAVLKEVQEIEGFAINPLVLEAIQTANRRYEGRSAEQRTAILRRAETEWLRSGEAILNLPASQFTRDYQIPEKEETVHVALFATDREGGLAVSINRYPAFRHDQEAWWRAAMQEGKTRLSNVYFDDLAQAYVFDIVAPVKNRGQTIGAIKTIIHLKELLQTSIFHIRFGRTGHAMLIDGDGVVLVCPILPTGMHVTDALLVRNLSVPRPAWFVAENDAHGGTNSIVGTAPVIELNQLLSESGAKSWYSFIRQDPKESFGPVRTLLVWVAAAGGLLIVLLISLNAVIGRRLLRPIHLLHEGAERISQGNLSHRIEIRTNDEIEQLANEFNRMAQSLKDSYGQLEQRVADRTRELSALNVIATTVNQSLKLQEILDDTLVKILEVVQVDAGAVHLWDEEERTLRLQSYRGIPEEMIQTIMSIGEGEYITGRVIQTGEPIHIHNAQEGHPTESPLLRAGFRSVVCIPLRSKARLLGTLIVGSRSPHTFTAGEMQLLFSIGFQMGVAVENATLYQRAHEMVEKLKEMDRFKSEFLSNVSHELRMPLTAILGFSELLLDRIGGDLTAEQEEYLKNMQESGHHLLEIINNLLDLSKLRAGRMEVHPVEFDLAELLDRIRKTVSPLIRKKDLRMEISVSPKLVRLYLDQGKLKQILLNLLSNAIKFTPPGGRIGIEAVPARLGEEPAIQVSVSDTGIGIRPDDLDRIFEEFRQADSSYTREFSGTGLGLTITKRFVELQGGQLRVQSQYGQGSTFTFTLPSRLTGAAPMPTVPTVPEPKPAAASSSATEPVAVPKPAEPSTVPPRILVVEDDPMVNRLLGLYLSQEGYHVDVAFDGEEAIEKAKALQPFAITLDVMLPRQDGWEVLQTLKILPETRHIPVIIISIIENRELGFSLGATDYFTKPIDRRALIESIKRHSLTTKMMRKPVTILAVDDDPKILLMISSILEAERFGVLRAQRAEEGIALAIEAQPDLILMDLLMPEMSGFEAIERLKAHPTAKNIPIIVFTAHDLSEEERRQLTHKIRGILTKGKSLKDDIVEEIRKFEKLYPDKAKMVDGLTGYYNERYLHNRLSDEANRALRVRRGFSLLLINIDRFRQYNERMGILQGDRLLQQVAELFRKQTRAANPLCRCGGSTFAVLLTETPLDTAVLVGEKMRSSVEQQAFPDRITVSVGVAAFLEDADTPERLMVQAARALEQAKRMGGNRVVKVREVAPDAP